LRNVVGNFRIHPSSLKQGRNLLTILTTLFVLTLYSCSDKRDFETYLSEMNIELIDNYDVVSTSQLGFTDWTLEAEVIISENDKENILRHLNRLGEIVQVQTEKEYFDIHAESENATWTFLAGSKYFHHFSTIRKDDMGEILGYETFDVVIDTLGNRLSFKYEYE
jgi:hypothetical protein